MGPISEAEDYSLLHIERITQYISLPPACLSHPLPAVCASIFSPLLLSYYPPARGIVLAYEDVKLSDSPPEPPKTASEKENSKERKQKHAHPESDTEDEEDEEGQGNGEETLLLYIRDEYSAPFLWATASFLVWRPAVGAWISARVTSQSSTHLTLSHLNSFPISILRQRLPDDWSWVPNQSGRGRAGDGGGGGENEGYWVDEDGNPIEDLLRVRIRDFEGRMDGKGRGRGGLKIDGSLVSEEVEKARAQESTGEQRKRREKRAKGAMKAKEAVDG